MAETTYINSGGLFINDRKEKETHPDYNGKVTVDKAGLYYINGWKKQTKNFLWSRGPGLVLQRENQKILIDG